MPAAIAKAMRIGPPRALVLAVLLLVGAWPAAADSLPIDAFYGRWEGMAMGKSLTTSSKGKVALEYGARDLDVTIAETEKGFSVTWSTVRRASNNSADGQLRRNLTTARFIRASPTTFEPEVTRGIGAGRSHTWARLEGRSLIVYVFEIDAAGVYELARYARTISASGVMDLRFTRTRDGKIVREVGGSLVPADR